jgi:ATP-dependent Lon protease
VWAQQLKPIFSKAPKRSNNWWISHTSRMFKKLRHIGPVRNLKVWKKTEETSCLLRWRKEIWLLEAQTKITKLTYHITHFQTRKSSRWTATFYFREYLRGLHEKMGLMKTRNQTDLIMTSARRIENLYYHWSQECNCMCWRSSLAHMANLQQEFIQAKK